MSATAALSMFHLGVAVQLQRVALFHAGLHAAGGVEDQESIF